MNAKEFDRQYTVATVLAGMREDIFLGKYKNKQSISEAEIAKKYGVSRSSVRAAFQELISDGLLEMKDNGRKELRTIDKKYIEDLCLTRSILECEACRIILDKRNNDFTKLLHIVGGFYSALQEEDRDKRRHLLVELNENFHDQIFTMTENVSLIQCRRTIAPMLSTIVHFNASLDPNMNEHGNYESHNKIAQMLMDKNMEVIDFMRYHVQDAAMKDVLRAIEQAQHEEREPHPI